MPPVGGVVRRASTTAGPVGRGWGVTSGLGSERIDDAGCEWAGAADALVAAYLGGYDDVAGVAGLLAAAASGQVEAGLTFAVTVTGHGLKDIDTALSGAGALVDAIIDADVDAAAEAAGLL